jgi:hypothetical protein
MPDLLSADCPENSAIRGRDRDGLSSRARRYESVANALRHSNPSAGSSRSQGINDVASEGTGNVQAGEWGELPCPVS